jgi:hypothetical protein
MKVKIKITCIIRSLSWLVDTLLTGGLFLEYIKSLGCGDRFGLTRKFF